MPSTKTEKCIAAMVKAGLEEGIIYAFSFSYSFAFGKGTTSAAVRVAKQRGLIEEVETYSTYKAYRVGNISAHDKMKYLAS
jgi:hypothetical protein